MINKILIANRGEIALRIIRACKDLGIKTVAVHSEVDINSLHVRFADESVCIGPAKSELSYLNIPAIISAAEISGAEAIHPGYGFLAENPNFAEICETCQFKFIGPSPQIIRLMGDKCKAKEVMKKAGVPIIPGSDEPIQNMEQAIEIANSTGYPVIIKAKAGGGGRGMRIVHNDATLKTGINLLKTEAANAFGDPDLYIEKYITNARHIEIQIMGDEHGNIVHLGERDCTLQRRHQKLLEESPSPAINAELRKKISDAALKGAKKVGYFSAGTMEFLVQPDGKFYFIEMNTRIQVEHPVTEMVTGLPLVEEQIKIASGNKLSFTQKDITSTGHSIECRINAENPKTFAPCPGIITTYNVPGGLGVRVDTAAYSQYTVLPYYDSLVAKLIVHADTRENAIKRMGRALDEFIIEGIDTTIPFHKKILTDYNFYSANFDTGFIENFSL
jgi:acetyl-CoA carboxylase, biotin carboxylase subunit